MFQNIFKAINNKQVGSCLNARWIQTERTKKDMEQSEYQVDSDRRSEKSGGAVRIPG
jgi:hypothetical protein